MALILIFQDTHTMVFGPSEAVRLFERASDLDTNTITCASEFDKGYRVTASTSDYYDECDNAKEARRAWLHYTRGNG